MKRLLLLLIALLCAVLCPLRAYADNATAYTYTLGAAFWTRTQDAYLVSDILFKDYDLSVPEDLYIHDGLMYVADTGNARIVAIDLETGGITEVISEGLQTPTGIFVNDKHIYVADYSAKAVLCFDKSGALLKTFERPKSLAFGRDTTFLPRKVMVENDNIMYVVSEGSFDGIIQITTEGEFIGYFGVNTVSISPLEALADLIFTEEQKARMFNRIPYTFYNITRDNNGLIYTVTQRVKGEAVKKHNISGVNLISLDMLDENNFVDLEVGLFGQIYAVTETGLIFEYNNDGYLTFTLGGRAVATERNGLFTVVSAIEVDDNDVLYVLDREKAIVHVFVPTSFAAALHQASALYDDGRYEESKTLWQEILRQSGNSLVAHHGLGMAEFQLQNYEAAMKHFKIALSQDRYSNSFWEVRNQWLTDNMGAIIICIAALFAAVKLLSFADRKKKILDPVRNMLKRAGNVKLLYDLAFIVKFIRHPIDSFYYLRRDRMGSAAAASIIYAAAFVIFTANFVLMGFVISSGGFSSFSLSYITILFFLPIALWVFCNYLVASINEGRGRIRDVYNLTAYSLMPYVFFMPILIIVSHVLTLNEIFVVEFGSTAIYVWCAVLLVIGLKEIHDYEIGDVVKNVFITLFFMGVVVIVFSMVFMFWDQLVEFVYSVVKEVGYRGR